jgi:hypothetical protein
LVPSSWLNSDFNLAQRFVPQTAAGAFEYALVGLEEYANESLRIYPNPSNGELIIKGITNCKLSIIDPLGTAVFSGIVKANEKLDLTSLKKGVYFLIFDEKISKSLVVE